jgi:hypothetical protein
MAKKPPRISMKGMGADAFFAPPTAVEVEMADEPDTDIPVSQLTSLPVDQEAGKSVDQETGKPVDQQVSMTANQDTGIPVNQNTSKPVYMKATYYITAEQDMKLEMLRLARRGQGEKVDKSALIREAIDHLTE